MAKSTKKLGKSEINHCRELAAWCYQYTLKTVTPNTVPSPLNGGLKTATSRKAYEQCGFEWFYRPSVQIFKHTGDDQQQEKSKNLDQLVPIRKAINNKNASNNQNKIFQHHKNAADILKSYRELHPYSRQRLSKTDPRVLEKTVAEIVAQRDAEKNESKQHLRKPPIPVKVERLKKTKKTSTCPAYSVMSMEEKDEKRVKRLSSNKKHSKAFTCTRKQEPATGHGIAKVPTVTVEGLKEFKISKKVSEDIQKEQETFKKTEQKCGRYKVVKKRVPITIVNFGGEHFPPELGVNGSNLNLNDTNFQTKTTSSLPNTRNHLGLKKAADVLHKRHHYQRKNMALESTDSWFQDSINKRCSFQNLFSFDDSFSLGRRENDKRIADSKYQKLVSYKNFFGFTKDPSDQCMGKNKNLFQHQFEEKRYV